MRARPEDSELTIRQMERRERRMGAAIALLGVALLALGLLVTFGSLPIGATDDAGEDGDHADDSGSTAIPKPHRVSPEHRRATVAKPTGTTVRRPTGAAVARPMEPT